MNTEIWDVQTVTRTSRAPNESFSMSSFGIAEDPDAEARKKRGVVFGVGVAIVLVIAAVTLSRASHAPVAARPVEAKPAPVVAAPPESKPPPAPVAVEPPKGEAKVEANAEARPEDRKDEPEKGKKGKRARAHGSHRKSPKTSG